jgi:penicillin G amidase
VKRFPVASAFMLAALISPLVLAGVALSGAPAARQGGAPETTMLKVAGIREKVTVRYDDRGIPHISAKNEADLFVAQGYVVAKERLWQMDLLRRTGRGQLAEIFGRVVLQQDQFHRKFDFSGLADQSVSRLSPEAKRELDDYCRGVNEYINTLGDKDLPVEFRLLQYKPTPWLPSDTMILGKLFAEMLSTSFPTDLMRAALASLPKEKQAQLFTFTSPLDVILTGSDKTAGIPKRTDHSPSPVAGNRVSPDTLDTLELAAEMNESARAALERVGLYAQDMAASNNWVVSGRHTATGKPLLANDPHLDASAPSIWYMADLSAPGLHVAGIAVPGAPGIVIGHNDRVAWGITNVEADVQDLYIEKFDPANPQRYMTPTGWKTAEVRHEDIKVRKVPTDPATETVPLEVTVTRHGPIILERNGTRYALGWPALDPTTRELECYYFLQRAHNWQEFSTALNHYSGNPLNFIYADVDGHIGWWAAGRYPIRRTGQGTVPYDGATDAGDWTGYVPAPATPHLVDPDEGIIVTANNRTVGLDYPYYLGYLWAPPYRARRIHDLLKAKTTLGIEDFLHIQGDTYSIPDATFATRVAEIARPLASQSPEWTKIQSALEGWDGMMNADSHIAPIVSTMRTAFQRRILAAALGADLSRRYQWSGGETLTDQIITSRPKEWLPKEFDSYEALLLACYKDAIEQLRKKLGDHETEWTWGALNLVRFPHPLSQAPMVGAQFAIAPFPQNGGEETVNRGSNVSMRLVADPSDWDRTRQGIALGESGNPKSPHWKDQLPDWQAVTPRALPFSDGAVSKATQTIVILEP